MRLRDHATRLTLSACLVSSGLACTSELAEHTSEDGGPGEVAVVPTPVERGSMVVRRRYPGELFSDAVELGSRVQGRVEDVHVRIGDHVTADQPVAKMDDELLARQLRELRALHRA